MFAFLIVIPAPRLRGGRLRESILVKKMDTRLRGYDTTQTLITNGRFFFGRFRQATSHTLCLVFVHLDE